MWKSLPRQRSLWQPRSILTTAPPQTSGTAHWRSRLCLQRREQRDQRDQEVYSEEMSASSLPVCKIISILDCFKISSQLKFIYLILLFRFFLLFPVDFQDSVVCGFELPGGPHHLAGGPHGLPLLQPPRLVKPLTLYMGTIKFSRKRSSKQFEL